ncbi:MAG: FtsQ-type POTRA domain-containing protein [Candidatus Paceibacterota bacterium]
MKRQLRNKRIVKSWQKKKKGAVRVNLKNSHRILNKKTMIFFAVLLFSFSLFYTFLFSDYFKIKNIKVSGNQTVSVEEINIFIKKDFAEKIYGHIPADNYFALNTKNVDKKLAENFNEIKTVKIIKDFPNGIVVNIEEKNSALIWCRDECYFVNEQGIAFLQANEEEISSQERHFIKITEELEIAEETTEDRDSVTKKDDDIQNSTENSEEDGAEKTAEVLGENISTGLQAITVNQQVSDESFISFALDIDSRMIYNQKLKIKHYKTRGYKTRELIAFTDKNTKLYFDTTQSAQKQVDNLNHFLEESIERDKIDSLQYIYLKNEDRIFYK